MNLMRRRVAIDGIPVFGERAIMGGYPGGPSRVRPCADAPTTLASGPSHGVEDIEAHREVEALRKRRARRVRHWVAGTVAFLVVAVASGVLIGRKDRQSAESLTEATMQSTVEQPDLSRETRRVLAELWKMEELERSRRP